jgi:hypothetical protein
MFLVRTSDWLCRGALRSGGASRGIALNCGMHFWNFWIMACISAWSVQGLTRNGSWVKMITR